MLRQVVYHFEMERGQRMQQQVPERDPGVELRANLESISHRCRLFEVAFVWELTKETIHLPLGCLQGGECFIDNLLVRIHFFIEMVWWTGLAPWC